MRLSTPFSLTPGPQNFTGIGAEQQFQTDHRSPRVVTGMISSMDVNLLVSGTMGFQLLFIRTDAANTQRKYLTNGCPLTAMVKAV
jgi:hypothetical protein